MAAKVKAVKSKEHAGYSSGVRNKTERILNCLPSPKRESDWSEATAYNSGILAAAPVPQAKDLRDPSWWTVGNQEKTGACVGWATADSVIRWHLATANKIRKDADERLSPRYIWMAAKETDEFTTRPTSFIESDGTSLKAALDIARKYGVVLDSVLPFVGGTLYGDTVEVFYAVASQLRISGYFSLRPEIVLPGMKSSVLGKWRKWLAMSGPILTRLDVDDTWDGIGSDGKLVTYHAETARGGHAVALVGYDKDHFIVRNSWGADWGHGGFAYASNNYAFAAFTEAYGVVT